MTTYRAGNSLALGTTSTGTITVATSSTSGGIYAPTSMIHLQDAATVQTKLTRLAREEFDKKMAVVALLEEALDTLESFTGQEPAKVRVRAFKTASRLREELESMKGSW